MKNINWRHMIALLLGIYLTYNVVLTYSNSKSVELPPMTNGHEKGKIAGEIGGGAMALDAYYEICVSNGLRTDKNLKEVDKLLKKKWGFSFSQFDEMLTKQAGKSQRQQMQNLVNQAIQQTGGCETDGMKYWLKQFQAIHQNNLNKFNASKL